MFNRSALLVALALMLLTFRAHALELVLQADGYRTDWFSTPVKGQGSLTETTCNARKGYSFVRTFAQFPAQFSDEQLEQVWQDGNVQTSQADWVVRFDSALDKTQLFVRAGAQVPRHLIAADTQRGLPTPAAPLDCSTRLPVEALADAATARSAKAAFESEEIGPVPVLLPLDKGFALAEVAQPDVGEYVLFFSLGSEAERQRVLAAFEARMAHSHVPFESMDSVSPLARVYRDRYYEVSGGRGFALALVNDPASPGHYGLEVGSIRADSKS